jgi:hypothetical protein
VGNRLLPLALGLFCTPIPALAQYTNPPATQPVVCPWLTQGTAAKMLGGDVSMLVNVSESGEGSCKFTREQRSPEVLEIVVKKAALPGCPDGGIALRGVGNEAAMCSRSEPPGQLTQTVAGRVRDRRFTVTITKSARNKAAKPQDPQDEPAARIAEQVAGSLF